MTPAGATEPSVRDDEPVASADWYSTGFLFPLTVGAITLLAAALLFLAPSHPTGARIASLDSAVALLLLGVAVYFLLGLWLIPSTFLAGGLVFLGANVVIVHFPVVGPPLAVVATLAGALGILLGLRSFGRISRGRVPSSE